MFKDSTTVVVVLCQCHVEYLFYLIDKTRFYFRSNVMNLTHIGFFCQYKEKKSAVTIAGFCFHWLSSSHNIGIGAFFQHFTCHFTCNFPNCKFDVRKVLAFSY